MPNRRWMLMDVTDLPPGVDLPTLDAEIRFFDGDIDDLMGSTGWLTSDDLRVFRDNAADRQHRDRVDCTCEHHRSQPSGLGLGVLGAGQHGRVR